MNAHIVIDRSERPSIAFAMGDPGRHQPGTRGQAHRFAEEFRSGAIVVFRRLRILAQGANVAGVDVDVEVVRRRMSVPEGAARPVFVDLKQPDPIR